MLAFFIFLMSQNSVTKACKVLARNIVLSQQRVFVEAAIYKSLFRSIPDLSVDDATEVMAIFLSHGYLKKVGLTYQTTERFESAFEGGRVIDENAFGVWS